MEGKTKEELEAEIKKAMLNRVNDFKEEADKLTLEGVRRKLEKDLGLNKFKLDAHKTFIKQCMDKFYYGAENMSKPDEKTTEELEKEEREGDELQSAIKNISSDINENEEGSPAMVGEGPLDHETEKESLDPKNDIEISEDIIKMAIRKRADFLKSNLQITLVEVRRLLEEDLKLEKKSLDAYKKFISSEIDEVLQASETDEAANGDSKEQKKASHSKNTKKGARKASMVSDSSDSKGVISEDEESDEEVRRPKKRPAKRVNTKGVKKQKTSSGKKSSVSRKKKQVESDLEKSDESDDGKSTEGSHSESSAEEEVKKRSGKQKKVNTKRDTKVSKKQKASKSKPVESEQENSDEKAPEGSDSESAEEAAKTKNEKSTQGYGRKVEKLKSIIKSCGMGVPPSVYKRAKQAPESKRETFLVKELEQILEREGLSTNPSEKDIKAVKKRKARAKELEGIDTSNIVTSSRRRSTSNYIPLAKPKIDLDSEEDEENEDNNDENNEDSENGDDEGGETSEGSDEDDAEEEEDSE